MVFFYASNHLRYPHCRHTKIRKRIKMNRVFAYTPSTNQESEIRDSTSKRCTTTLVAKAEVAAVPRPSATASGWLSLISVWLSTLPPIDAARVCQSASPQVAHFWTDAPLRLWRSDRHHARCRQAGDPCGRGGQQVLTGTVRHASSQAPECLWTRAPHRTQ